MSAEKSDREHRIVLGFVLLAAYAAGLGLLWSSSATALGSSTEADTALSAQIFVLAGATVVTACVLAVRYWGAAAGLKLIAREAWPGMLAGWALTLLTGFALRVLVPAGSFWFVLVPIYAAAVAVIYWFANRAPRSDINRGR